MTPLRKGASPINAPRGPADMRDVLRLHERLGEAAAEAARQTLEAHKASLKRIDETHTRLDAIDGRLRGIESAQQKQSKRIELMLVHLERLVVVPGPIRVLAPDDSSPLVARLTRVFGMSPATTRLMLAATLAAVFASALTACTMSVAHAATNDHERLGGVYP